MFYFYFIYAPTTYSYVTLCSHTVSGSTHRSLYLLIMLFYRRLLLNKVERWNGFKLWTNDRCTAFLMRSSSWLLLVAQCTHTSARQHTQCMRADITMRRKNKLDLASVECLSAAEEFVFWKRKKTEMRWSIRKKGYERLTYRTAPSNIEFYRLSRTDGSTAQISLLKISNSFQSSIYLCFCRPVSLIYARNKGGKWEHEGKNN